MDIVDRLNHEFLKQDFAQESPRTDETAHYREVAQQYAEIENAIAVLSDMRTNMSYIYYGGFARTLGIRDVEEGKVDSIWEEDILRLIHPDDLRQKYLQEMRYFQFTRKQPASKRKDFYLMEKLRMRNSSGHYVAALHRLFHIQTSAPRHHMRLALCLYSPLSVDFAGNGVVVDSTTGQVMALNEPHGGQILSDRERQVLRLIEKGMQSKQIAETLSISIHTVSRHRQEILGKLQVCNSIEACRIAKDLGIL